LEIPTVTETVGQYRIIKKLGAGGMGEVFLAQDTLLNRRVAIKFLSPGKSTDIAAIKRLVREARAAARLDHPNICAIHEVRNDESGNYIVMQYVEGESLDAILNRKRFEIAEVLSIGVQLANALTEAHAGNVVHRDIKPQNIMINTRAQVKVLDFGLAKIEEAAKSDLANASTRSLLTNPNVIIGTPPYMSPEHMQPEEMDSRSDIFSVGIVLYEMIAGKHPFLRKTTPSTISAILTNQPPDLINYRKDVPPGLERIVRKCLEKDKATRYQTAGELSSDLLTLSREIDRGTSVVGNRSRLKARYSLLVLVILAVVLGGFYAIRGLRRMSWPGTPTVHEPTVIDSVAILPFTCEGTDVDLRYLCDGITESIINKLSSVPHLRVSARTSVLRYKERDADALAAGRELKVKSVVTGRLTKQGDELKLQIDLIDVAGGSQIWGHGYTQKVSNVLLIQDDICAQIAQNLRLQLSSKELNRLTKHNTDNTEAYMLYVRGRFFWNRRTVEDLKKAVESFTAAIKLDPEYALAYTGLADTYLIQTRYGVGPPRELLPRAKEAAERAITLDEELAEAHTSLASIKAEYDWDWPVIEREHRRAIELNPNYPTAHNFFAWYLMAMGRFDEAKAEMKLALESDPGSLSITASMGLPYYYSGDPDKAIDQYRKCLDMDSDFILGRWYLGMAYEQKGMYDEAIGEWTRIKLTDTSPELLANLAYSYALSGRKAEALEYLAELNSLSRDRYVSPFQVGTVYFGLGDLNQAFTYFEKAYTDRALPFTLNVDPRFGKLHTDPRFLRLIRYLHLEGSKSAQWSSPYSNEQRAGTDLPTVNAINRPTGLTSLQTQAL
jgi:serine/threonine protein kinase/tetratricopeptide (TPR) repeat protein